MDLANEETGKKEEQIAFLRENIQKDIKQVQKQNEIGLKMSQLITEGFAAYYSGMENKNPTTELDSFNKYFETKGVKYKPKIEPLDIDGTKLEFPKFNRLVEKFNEPFMMNYENSFDALLMKMENGENYHIDNNQLIFKLHLPKNYSNFYIDHSCVAAIAEKNANNIFVMKDGMVVYDEPVNPILYEIYLQIPNYGREASKTYMFPRNETTEKLLMTYGKDNKDVKIFNYESEKKEILFHITKII